MTKKLRNSVIVECTATECEFANGDVIAFSDDVINDTGEAGKNDVYGYCQSFDFFDAKAGKWFCGFELFQTFSGHIYNLAWYEIEYTEYDTPYVSDFEYAYDKCLSTLSMYPNNIEFWHAIYKAIQQL